tara:strand:- start:271 stop:681 length:411 start_codon:yes stop_codon:yes gene_type:complete
MINNLKRLFKLNDGEIVKYADLATVEVGKWHSLHASLTETQGNKLNKDVWYKRFDTKKPGQLIFIARIFKGSGFHYHSHDCKETITPINGNVTVNDKRVLNNDESYTFFANTKHKVHYHSSDNDEYLDVFVEFNKR